jgi:hypothetical protein
MTASTMTRTTDRSMETTPSGATTAGVGAVSPWIRPWLRAEGVAVFAAGLAGFLAIGAPWYLVVLLLLVPDASAVGYLRGPRVGAIVYNLAHDLATGVVIAGIGIALGAVPLMAAGAILVAHSGMDRLAGYGLKLPTSFQDTHLGRIGRGR